MYYATLFVCALAAATCDAEHAVYLDQSEPDFASVAECTAAAEAQFYADLGRIAPLLTSGVEYQFVVICDQADTPAL